MILSFGDPATAALFDGQRGGRTKRFPADIRRAAVRKLDMLNAAHELTDMRSPPGNRLEALRGDRAGFHSVRVNEQWRIVFRWTGAGPSEVALIDYH